MENLPTPQNPNEILNTTTTDKLPSPAKRSNKQLTFLASFIIVIFIFITALYFLKGARLFPTSSDLGKTQNQTITIQKEKNNTEDLKLSFLNSKVLSIVTIGAALNYVPVTEMKIDNDYATYKFQFYGLELTEEQHKEFVRYAYPYGEFPGSTSIINDSPVWLASLAGGSEMLLTKRGFVCTTPINYGPILCADNGSGSCMYPHFKGLKCAFVKNPKENNFVKVSQFIQESLKEAKINCGGQCIIKEMGEDQVTIGEFSRGMVYFKGIDTQNAEKYVNLVEQEAIESVNYFKKAGWAADKKDITGAERGSIPGVFSSIEITSSNNLFDCGQTITISNRWGVEATGSAKKREIIKCSINPSKLGETTD